MIIEKKMDIDKIFLLPPSCFATFSGVILGGVINLFTTLLFEKGTPYNLIFMEVAIILLFFSVILFSYISIKLEILREKLQEHPHKERHLIHHIGDNRKALWLSFLGGFICALIGLYFIFKFSQSLSSVPLEPIQEIPRLLSNEKFYFKIWL